MNTKEMRSKVLDLNNNRIVSNFVPRLKLYGYELTPKEREEFDWMDNEEISSAGFIKYKGIVYAEAEIMSYNQSAEFWHGYHADCFFHATLFHFPEDDQDTVVCGEVYC